MRQDLIRLKDGATSPDLERGELALYEAGRELTALTQDRVQVMPLDRVALELPDENASSQVYVYGPGGIAVRTTLDAGAGGTPLDGRAWRIPGLIPSLRSQHAYTNIHETFFTVAEPILIRSYRMRVVSGLFTSFPIQVFNEDDVQIKTTTILGATGVHRAANVNLSLDPGSYRLVLSTGAPVTLETISGYLPWRAGLVRHAVMMEVI